VTAAVIPATRRVATVPSIAAATGPPVSVAVALARPLAVAAASVVAPAVAIVARNQLPSVRRGRRRAALHERLVSGEQPAFRLVGRATRRRRPRRSS
jgi:hypothetical protein